MLLITSFYFCTYTKKLRLYSKNVVGNAWRMFFTLSGKIRLVFVSVTPPKEQAVEAGKSHLLSVQVQRQCIPAAPGPAPWSLEQRGIDPATNVSVDHRRTQQDGIVLRHRVFNHSRWLVSVPAYLHWDEVISAGLVYEWTDEYPRKKQTEEYTRFISVSLIFFLTNRKLLLHSKICPKYLNLAAIAKDT